MVSPVPGANPVSAAVVKVVHEPAVNTGRVALYVVETYSARGTVGVWNCESGDYIKGCDGTCIHAVSSLAGADGWNITNVAAFFFVSAYWFAPRFSLPRSDRRGSALCLFLMSPIRVVDKPVHGPAHRLDTGRVRSTWS